MDSVQVMFTSQSILMKLKHIFGQGCKELFALFPLQWLQECYLAFLRASSPSGVPSLQCPLLLLLRQLQLLVPLMLHRAAQRLHKQLVRITRALLKQSTPPK